MASDFQDPPEMIPELLKKWEAGNKVVKCVKSQSLETPVMYQIRKFYYDLVNRLSDVPLTKNFTGSGLYDKVVLNVLRGIKDPYPYFRGLISEIGFQTTHLDFVQPTRKRGITKNNFYTLYDIAMLGITNHSKVPLRLATMFGFLAAGLSFVVGLGYGVAKLVFWDRFQLGIAPLVVGLCFFAAIQLLFIGILGEYIGAIHTIVLNRPLIVERERLNFDIQRPT
jgi:glycosyltransferase involved in cell wall biosynthesis